MPTMLCDHDSSLIARAALDELPDDERAALDVQLAACPACRARFDDYRALLGGLAHLFDPARASAGLPTEGRHAMTSPTKDDPRQPPVPIHARPRVAPRRSALAGGLVAALLIVALAGVYAFFGPGRAVVGPGKPIATTPATQAPLSCANAPEPHSVLSIGNAIGAPPFWVGGFFGDFPGRHATLDVQGALTTPHGGLAKVVTQLAPGTTQPVTLSGKRLSDGAALWFQFDAGFGPAAPSATESTFDPALSLNDAGYILIPSTGCYALTARWATGSWTLTFQGIV